VAACGNALAYSESGYYAGAWAATNSVNCVGDGVNPAGGCAPGTFPLAFAHAQQAEPGARRSASATADLTKAGLWASADIPNNENGSGAAANFMETITIVGSLPSPAVLSFTMRVDSTFNVYSDSAQYAVQATLATGAGDVAAYDRTTPLGSCFAALAGGAECTASTGFDRHSITRSVTVSDANRSFMLGATLRGGGWSMSTEASLQLSIQLPDGLSYTSASGVFPAAAVPEPQTWMLMVLGLAALCGLQARRLAPPRG
jgi:hypothetical protein